MGEANKIKYKQITDTYNVVISEIDKDLLQHLSKEYLINALKDKLKKQYNIIVSRRTIYRAFKSSRYSIKPKVRLWSSPKP